MDKLSRYEEQAYALLRMVIGFLFACHGAQKIFGLFGELPGEMPPVLLWSAGLIELIGGTLVAIGLFTRWAAFLSSGCMAVGYFLVHQKNHLLPIVNHGELASIYAWVFLYISTRGDGLWSVGQGRGQAPAVSIDVR